VGATGRVVHSEGGDSREHLGSVMIGDADVIRGEDDGVTLVMAGVGS
jgi:hypothetical protein